MTELTAKQVEALGLLFAAEIESAGKPDRATVRKLPAAVARRLVRLGLVVEAQEEIPAFAGLSMTVTGYRLSWAGHAAFCAWAAENVTEAPA